MKKWRNKILSAVLVLSLLLTSSSFAFAVGEEGNENEGLVQIPRTQLSIAGFSSQQFEPNGSTDAAKNEGPAKNAIDGDTSTFWHTIWTGTDPETGVGAGKDADKFIIIDLGDTVYLKKFTLLPRQQGGENNVRIGSYSIYTTTTLNSNGEPEFSDNAIKTGVFEDNTNKQTVIFDESVLARYIKIKSNDPLSGEGGRGYATIAELEFFMDASKNPSITTQPVSTASNSNVVLSVTAQANNSGTLSYQWYVSNNGSEFTEVSKNDGGNNASITVTPQNTMVYYYVKVTETNEEGISLSVDSNTVYVVTAESNEVQITKSLGLSVSASSYHSGNDVSYVIDGKKDNNTTGNGNFWETEYNEGSVDTDKWIQFDLGCEYYFSKLIYYPRVHNTMNGSLVEYELYVSLDGENWSLIAENSDNLWSWKNSITNQNNTITLATPALARYVKIIPVKTKGATGDSDNKTMSADEVELFADISKTIKISGQPEGVNLIAENGQVTNNTLKVVASSVSNSELTYQWYSNDENSYIGAEQITTGNSAQYDAENVSKYYFVKITDGDSSVYSDIAFVKSTEAKIIRNGEDYYYTTLNEAKTASVTGETIYIMRDIEVSSTIEVSGAKSITISGINGDSKFIVKRASGFDNAIFKISNASANVTFENIIIDGGAIWSGNIDANSTLNRGENNTGISVNGSDSSLIYITNGIVTVDNSILQNNQKNGDFDGGAVKATGTSNVTIKNSSILNNEARFGSAIYSFNSVNITIENVTVTGNKGRNSGGVFCVDGSSNLTINGENTLIENNSGLGAGGVIWLSNGTVNLNEGTIRNNTGSGNGAIYLSSANSKVNVGDITMSGNTVSSSEIVNGVSVGTGINYFNGKVTIIGNPNFSDDTNIFKKNNELFVTFAESCDLTNNINVIVQGNQATQKIAEAATDEQAQNLISFIKIPTPDNRVVYCSGTSIKYGEPASITSELVTDINVMSTPEGTASATLSVTATGTDVTYKWYSCETENGEYEQITGQTGATLNLDNLTAGTTYYYCVIDNGEVSTNEPIQSATCKVTVSDFYPCSKAIEKFKNL